MREASKRAVRDGEPLAFRRPFSRLLASHTMPAPGHKPAPTARFENDAGQSRAPALEVKSINRLRHPINISARSKVPTWKPASQ
ncbi:MAG: hypothetical protein DI596_06275 [Azospira oryzae]|nr:MAG: hypothetical protein DI596_06275 [Azospira oryzae]PZP80494.1 MAG: hypothetical protein DI593_06275 [Azospira oryzae]